MFPKLEFQGVKCKTLAKSNNVTAWRHGGAEALRLPLATCHLPLLLLARALRPFNPQQNAMITTLSMIHQKNPYSQKGSPKAFHLHRRAQSAPQPYQRFCNLLTLSS